MTSPPTSSARPEHLLRFEATMGAVADGLKVRAGLLDDALDLYRARCGAPHRVDAAAGTDDMIRTWARGSGELGTWTGDVGRAFLTADAVDVITHGPWPGRSTVRRRDDAELLSAMNRWADPMRGVAKGAAQALAADLGLDDDQSSPPAWHRYLSNGGNITLVIGSLGQGVARTLATAPELIHMRFSHSLASALPIPDTSRLARALDVEARLRLPTASAARLATAATWVGRASNTLTFFSGATSQWTDDIYLDGPERAARAAIRGIGTAGGGFVGAFAIGGLATVQFSGLCGLAAPVCAAPFGILGGLGGAFLGDKFVDQLPGLKVDESTLHQRQVEHLEETLVHHEGPTAPELAGTVDLLASDIALGHADDAPPSFQADVARLLPDRNILIHAAQGRTLIPTTTTGTTIPDGNGRTDITTHPWPTVRPYTR